MKIELLDLLRASAFLDREIVGREIADELAAAVVDDDVDLDEIGAGAKDRRRRLLRARRRGDRECDDDGGECDAHVRRR